MKPITGKASLSVLLGAAFLMATSSIGPGFILQTAAFTGELKADFAFAIVVSVIFSIIAQLNVWTIIGVSKMRGQDIANKVLPGLGYAVAFLISLGGLAFNIGNIGGASMGLNIVFGIDMTRQRPSVVSWVFYYLRLLKWAVSSIIQRRFWAQ